MLEFYNDDNLEVMHRLSGRTGESASQLYDLIYTDVPFNTGATQQRGDKHYEDKHEDYERFLRSRMEYMKDLLRPGGSLLLQCDNREGHYIKMWLDQIFGRSQYNGEIIWTWDYGAKPKSKWANKHNYIFWFVKEGGEPTFNYEAVDRIPYLSRAFITEEKYKVGKIPTNVWFMTIVPTNSKENKGYPTQKPLLLAERIIRAHSNEGDWVLDPFAGSGTVGEACNNLDRNCSMIDNSDFSLETIRERFGEKIKEL